MRKLSKEAFLYLAFGILTTLIDYAFALGIYEATQKTVFSNTIAWIFAVLFAYITNKQYVFSSKCGSLSEAGKEFADFLFSRLTTLVISNVLIYICTLFSVPFAVSKIASSIVSITGNYILSKWFVFRKKEQVQENNMKERRKESGI